MLMLASVTTRMLSTSLVAHGCCCCVDQSKEKLVHVSVGSQSVWAVTDAGNIYFRTVVTQPLSSPLHPAWLPVTDGQKSTVQFCQVVTSENDLVVITR